MVNHERNFISTGDDSSNACPYFFPVKGEIMSVLIKGMKMPQNCMLCPFCVEEADPANGEMCMVTGTLMPPCTRERLDNCPLVPVPEHGRLIDADKLINDGEYHEVPIFDTDGSWDDNIKCIEVDDIVNAPTIIPADKGDGA